MFSEGVPMILGGDELSHSQQGNNNAYCQDNTITWLDWELNERRQKFLDFVRKCTRIWREQPVLQRRKFFNGRALRGSDIKDISFFSPDGCEMSDETWDAPSTKYLGVRLAGDLMNEFDERGEPIIGDTLLLLINAHWEEISFTLPKTRDEHLWESMVDTNAPQAPPKIFHGGDQYNVFGRSLVLLRTTMREGTREKVTPAQIESLRKKARRSNQPTPNIPPLR
jgi:glycogen operon protein